MNNRIKKSRRPYALSKFYIPYGLTADQYASEILADLRIAINKVNTISKDVEQYCSSINEMLLKSDELIWLDEKKKVKMFPHPRDENERIQKNWESTINSFINRSIRDIKSNHYGNGGSKEIIEFLDSMTHSKDFCSYMMPENKRTIDALYSDAYKLRTSENEKAEKERNEKILSGIGISSGIDCRHLDAMSVIITMENRLDSLYKTFLQKAMPASAGLSLFSSFKSACQSSLLPLAAEVRLESLLNEYESKFSSTSPMYSIDHMEGHEFEIWCAGLLRHLGFSNVEVTKGSGDQGVDVLATKDEIRYAIQCKCYSSDLGNKPVQEVHAGKNIYHCQVGVVMTNRFFTNSAKELASATGVLLWDRNRLEKMIEKVNSLCR